MTADKIPIFSVENSETVATSSGPVKQPMSPASAKSPKRAVPPFGNCFAARLIVPGHIRPTEKPHMPQPARFIKGCGIADAVM